MNAKTQWCLACGIAHTQAKAVGFDEEGEPACSLHGGIPDPLSVKEEAKPTPLPARACAMDGCHVPLRGDNNSGYCRTHRVQMQHRYCKAGCGVILRKNGVSDYCKLCRPNEEFAEMGTETAKTARQDGAGATLGPVKVSRVKGKGPEAGVFALKVSEAFLDQLWERMTPQQKVRALETMNG